MDPESAAMAWRRRRFRYWMWLRWMPTQHSGWDMTLISPKTVAYSRVPSFRATCLPATFEPGRSCSSVYCAISSSERPRVSGPKNADRQHHHQHAPDETEDAGAAEMLQKESHHETP